LFSVYFTINSVSLTQQILEPLHHAHEVAADYWLNWKVLIITRFWWWWCTLVSLIVGYGRGT